MRVADPLDGFRVLLTLAVGAFHAVSEMTWTLSAAETAAVIAAPAGRAVALGYGCVDGFFVLTGLFTTEALLRRWGASGKPPVSLRGDVLPVLEGRWVRLWAPLAAVVAWYVAAFAGGKYPMAAVRNEEALGAMTSFAVLTSRDRSPALPAARGSSLEMLPLLLAGAGNLAPFGGALSHMWSLAVQLQWYLWWPLLPWVAAKTFAACSKAKREPAAVAASSLQAGVALLILASAAFRALVFVKEAGFAAVPGGAANPVYSGFHFLWYAAAAARVTPLAVGAALALGRHAQPVHRLAAAPLHFVWDGLLAAAVIGLNLSVESDGDLTGVAASSSGVAGSHVAARAAAYVLCRPGGLLSSVFYARVVAAVAALPARAPTSRTLGALRWLATAAPYAFTFYLLNSSVYDIFYGYTRRLHPCAGAEALALIPASNSAVVASSDTVFWRAAGLLPDAIAAGTKAVFAAAARAAGGVTATGICDGTSSITAAGWAQIALFGGVCIAVTAAAAVATHHAVEMPLVAAVLRWVGHSHAAAGAAKPAPLPPACRTRAAVCCLRAHIALTALLGTCGAAALYALALLNVNGDTARRFAEETAATASSSF